MKRILLSSLLGALCVLAAGCATRGQVNPDVMQIATAPLTCSNADECATWWQRAQQWVRGHSTYEVETATDTLIQTSGPGGGKRALAYQITKTPNPDGTATIGFAAHCDSSVGCKPDPWDAGAAFKQFVRTGVEPARSAHAGRAAGAAPGADAQTGGGAR